MIKEISKHTGVGAGASAATLVAVAVIWGEDIRAGANAGAVVDSIHKTVEEIRKDNRNSQQQQRNDLHWYMEQMGFRRPPDSQPAESTGTAPDSVTDSISAEAELPDST